MNRFARVIGWLAMIALPLGSMLVDGQEVPLRITRIVLKEIGDE